MFLPGLEAGAHFDLGRRMEGRPAHGREKEGEPSLKPSVLDSPAQNQAKARDMFESILVIMNVYILNVYNCNGS